MSEEGLRVRAVKAACLFQRDIRPVRFGLSRRGWLFGCLGLVARGILICHAAMLNGEHDEPKHRLDAQRQASSTK